jgi:demethylmenaquinone methyltransferase/2-methoxy-6-polyprenyl-1,4-benzoquinol methylase
VISERNARARYLFEGIADNYDRPAELLSLGQYHRWRRRAVERLPLGHGSVVLDVGCGTGLVARELVRRRGARVVGLDLTLAMLRHAGGPRISVVVGRAEQLPFPDASFDGLVFTYLLRYVDDPAATLVELARVLRPGGAMASVEFGLPRPGPLRALWSLHARRLLPVLSTAFDEGWANVGKFLGPSIVAFNERWPPSALADLWRAAGMQHVVTERMTLGAGVVTIAIKGAA